MNNEDELVKEMASNMKKKFDKYWSEYSVLLAMAAIFLSPFKVDNVRV